MQLISIRQDQDRSPPFQVTSEHLAQPGGVRVLLTFHEASIPNLPLDAKALILRQNVNGEFTPYKLLTCARGDFSAPIESPGTYQLFKYSVLPSLQSSLTASLSAALPVEPIAFGVAVLGVANPPLPGTVESVSTMGPGIVTGEIRGGAGYRPISNPGEEGTPPEAD